MNRRRFTLSLLSLGMAATLALPAFAQDATPEATPMATAPMMAAPANAIASGLNDPRYITYDTDGSLFIAEAGAGGAVVLAQTPDGNATAGFTAGVSVVDKTGKTSPWLSGLISLSSPTGETLGIEEAYPQGDSVWLVVSGGAPGAPAPFYADLVEQVDKASGRIKTYIDLAAYETANNPDGGDVDSDASAVAWGPDGTLYIVDAAGNDILSWTAAGGLKTFAAWKDDPVPTNMAFAADGSIYVSFLGQGIAPGAGKIEHWSADGKTLIETFDKLNAVTDVKVGKDGGVYAVQLAQFGQQGPMPNSGSVVEVSKDGATTVADGLNAPFGLAQAPDGTWAVSVNSTFAPPGSGAVVKLGGS